jgi:hypothetical protein
MADPTAEAWVRAWMSFYDTIQMATTVVDIPVLLTDEESEDIFLGPAIHMYTPTLTENQYLVEMTLELSHTLESYRVAGSSDDAYFATIKNAMQVSINASVAAGDFQFAPPVASGSSTSGNPDPDDPDGPSGGPTSGSSSSGNPGPLPPIDPPDPPDPVDPPGEDDGE